MSIPTLIRNLIEPTVNQMKLDLVAVEWLGASNGMLLRVSVEGTSGVSAGICARVSREISPILDAEDPISGRYTLEVSSPGMNRPVQRPEDFQRFIGYNVKVRLEPGPPRRRYSGVLKGHIDGDVSVDVDGETFRFPLDAIERAHLVLSLDEYQALNTSDISIDEELVQ
jgi:ribosome maturation factor RimP